MPPPRPDVTRPSSGRRSTILAAHQARMLGVMRARPSPEQRVILSETEVSDNRPYANPDTNASVTRIDPVHTLFTPTSAAQNESQTPTATPRQDSAVVTAEVDRPAFFNNTPSFFGTSSASSSSSAVQPFFTQAGPSFATKLSENYGSPIPFNLRAPGATSHTIIEETQIHGSPMRIDSPVGSRVQESQALKIEAPKFNLPTTPPTMNRGPSSSGIEDIFNTSLVMRHSPGSNETTSGDNILEPNTSSNGLETSAALGNTIIPNIAIDNHPARPSEEANDIAYHNEDLTTTITATDPAGNASNVLIRPESADAEWVTHIGQMQYDEIFEDYYPDVNSKPKVDRGIPTGASRFQTLSGPIGSREHLDSLLLEIDAKLSTNTPPQSQPPLFKLPSCTRVPPPFLSAREQAAVRALFDNGNSSSGVGHAMFDDDDVMFAAGRARHIAPAGDRTHLESLLTEWKAWEEANRGTTPLFINKSIQRAEMVARARRNPSPSRSLGLVRAFFAAEEENKKAAADPSTPANTINGTTDAFANSPAFNLSARSAQERRMGPIQPAVITKGGYNLRSKIRAERGEPETYGRMMRRL